MQIELLNQKLTNAAADVKIVFVINKDLTHSWINDQETLQFLGLKVRVKKTLFTPTSKTLYVGCDSLDADEIRLAASNALGALKRPMSKTFCHWYILQ